MKTPSKGPLAAVEAALVELEPVLKPVTAHCRECCSKSGCQLVHPAQQHLLGDIQITSGLRHRHAALGYKIYCFDPERAAELPSRRL